MNLIGLEECNAQIKALFLTEHSQMHIRDGVERATVQ